MSLRATLFVTSILAFAPALGVAHAAEEDASTTVGSVTIQGERQERSDGATGLDLTLRETPQSVTQVSRQQIEDFALTNVNDLLSQVTGVNVERVETDRTYFNARGFAITKLHVGGGGGRPPSGGP